MTSIDTSAQLRRFLALEDVLIGFSDGIEHERLEAGLTWAKHGGAITDPLIRLFAAPWIAAAEEADWKGDPRAEAQKELEALAAQPSAGAQGEAWLDIATAPTDGTRVDVWLAPLSDDGVELTPCRCPDAWFEAQSWWAYGVGAPGPVRILHRITHWRPVDDRKPGDATPAQPDTGDVAALREALEPFARLEVPSKSVGNAGAYSILHNDIRRAQQTLAALSSANSPID